MTSAAILRRIQRLLLRLCTNTKGAAAIEFALVLPVMLTIYIGGSTVTQAISVDRRITLAAHAVADLTAQASSLSDSDISNIFDAAKAILAPYQTAPLAVTVTSITIDQNKKATVSWSKTLNGIQRSGDVTSAIPSDLLAAESCLVWGEATYGFTPAMAYVITGSIQLGDQSFMRPRLTAYATCVAKS